VDKLLSDGVRHGGGVAGLVEDAVDAFSDFSGEFAQGVVDCGSKSSDVVCFLICREGGVEKWADSRDWVGFFFEPFFEMHSKYTVEE